jgi:hypothetical protein
MLNGFANCTLEIFSSARHFLGCFRGYLGKLGVLSLQNCAVIDRVLKPAFASKTNTAYKRDNSKSWFHDSKTDGILPDATKNVKVEQFTSKGQKVLYRIVI